jgi:GTP cyclohydrolase I
MDDAIAAMLNDRNDRLEATVCVGAEAVGSNGSHAMSPSSMGFETLVREIICRLGEDPMREGLLKTPGRVEKSLMWLTAGYRRTPEEAIGDALFAEDIQDMVLVKDIEFYSMCEHHMLPFFGKVHIAYHPNGKIVGLSKLPRLVDIFARRLQVQERMTNQLADAVERVLAPHGVGVCVQALHLCMMMRGVETQNSSTLSLAMRGVFQTDHHKRDELLRLALGRP